MKASMTQAKKMALFIKNRVNLENDMRSLTAAALAIQYNQPTPPPPDGWSRSRWRAAIKQFTRSLEGGGMQ